MKELTDNSIMTFGEHKGKKMANVPAYYLIWVYENNKCTPAVAKYVSQNYDDLKSEAKK
jgi:uncharacterized protein (DUF3820 family)